MWTALGPLRLGVAAHLQAPAPAPPAHPEAPATLRQRQRGVREIQLLLCMPHAPAGACCGGPLRMRGATAGPLLLGLGKGPGEEGPLPLPPLLLCVQAVHMQCSIQTTQQT